MIRSLLLSLFLSLWASSLLANSAIYVPLMPPKAEDIIAFTNGLAPSTGFRREASRKQIMRFLRSGKNNLDVDSWYRLEHPRRGGIENCEGVMLDRRGEFVFWTLRSAKVLKLQTSDGRFALLQLR